MDARLEQIQVPMSGRKSVNLRRITTRTGIDDEEALK